MGRLFFLIGLVVSALIACMWVAGVISADVASDTLGRSLGIVAILGFVASAGFYVIGSGRQKAGSESTASKPNSGPKF